MSVGRVALLAQAHSPDAEYQAPADAEEFWLRDWTYVCKLVRTLLGNAQETADVSADIFEKLVTRKVYLMYHPQHVSKHTKRRVSWRSFLSAQVALYVRGKGEQVSRRLYREPLWCDAPAGDGTSRWVEMFGGQVWDDYPSLSDSDFVIRVREQLAELPECDGVSLLAMFEEILTLVKDGEKVTPAFLKKKFGVSAPAALAAIRDAIAGPSAPPVTFEVGGMQLTADEVRAAAEALKSWNGNQVRPAFAAAGHRLAEAGTKWYLEFAAEEQAEFPELKVSKKSHKDGHPGRVKGALIHRLERMVALAPVPAAQEKAVEELTTVLDDEPTAEDLLEYRLYQIGADPSEVVELLALARQAYGKS